MSAIPINRRRFERFQLNPTYSPIRVRLLADEHFSLDGHAYDISEGGIQFELDRAIAPGTPIAMQIDLPFPEREPRGPGRSIFIQGNVIWLDDEEPGPVRMALAITRFSRAGDRERLIDQLATGRLHRAA